MGLILGKYEEPAFEILLCRTKHVTTPYELRRYGDRFAVEADHVGESPFPNLAGYIGVFQKPKNEEAKSISMTAPVTMLGLHKGHDSSSTTASNQRRMQFILPAKYDDISKIPKPTNSNIRVTHLPPAVGAVHKYSGSLDRSKSTTMAENLAAQLKNDGVALEEDVLDHFQYWRYNPPMTIPALARNEVWIELAPKEVDNLVKKFSGTEAN